MPKSPSRLSSAPSKIGYKSASASYSRTPRSPRKTSLSNLSVNRVSSPSELREIEQKMVDQWDDVGYITIKRGKNYKFVDSEQFTESKFKGWKILKTTWEMQKISQSQRKFRSRRLKK